MFAASLLTRARRFLVRWTFLRRASSLQYSSCRCLTCLDSSSARSQLDLRLVQKLRFGRSGSSRRSCSGVHGRSVGGPWPGAGGAGAAGRSKRSAAAGTNVGDGRRACAVGGILVGTGRGMGPLLVSSGCRAGGLASRSTAWPWAWACLGVRLPEGGLRGVIDGTTAGALQASVSAWCGLAKHSQLAFSTWPLGPVGVCCAGASVGLDSRIPAQQLRGHRDHAPAQQEL